MDMFYVWHWIRWNFGKWEIAFHGTEEECKLWVRKNKGKYIISKEKPQHRLNVGTGF
jgi:hypothetical protein